MKRKIDDLPADGEPVRSVSVFLNYPTLDGSGRIKGVYPPMRFSRLISQVDELSTDDQGLSEVSWNHWCD